MRKKQVLLSGLLMLLGVSMASGQKVYTSVMQNDVKLDNLGTAAFDLSSSPSVKFVDGKAVMTVGGNQVAVLPMNDNGQLSVDLSGTESNVSMTLDNGYSTVYSPFQLQVPATGDVEVYAPTYENGTLKINATTKVAPGSIVPAGTALVLKNASKTQSQSTIDFTFSAEAATEGISSDLDGSAQSTTVPMVEEGQTLYVFGYNSATNDYGFIPYSGENLSSGAVYLVVDSSSEGEGKEDSFVSFNTEEDATAIQGVAGFKAGKNGKFVENYRVVIVKNNKKYNLNGQEVEK